jgi:hypothetical protein
MNTKPQPRKENIVIQELEKELLIYDLKINKAFSLNETCAMVWAECDGEKSIAEIASILSQQTKGLVNEEVVWLALETLQKENLLANSDEISAKFNGMSRREVIRKIGFASMVAIPVITSLIAPTAANAQSVVCVIPGGQPAGTTFLTSGFPGTCLPNSCDFQCQNSQGFCCSNRAFDISCFASLGTQSCTCECNFPL